MAPPIIYVMGPSGAGKDTILRRARAMLSPRDRVAFAHRYITRTSDPSRENNVELSAAEFEVRRDAGLFAFDWHAHGYSYGVGVEIEDWRDKGFTVVVSGSRAHFAGLARSPALVPVVITAREDALAQRLAARGQESPDAILERLRRRPEPPADVGMTVIDNSSSPEVATADFVALLRTPPGWPPNQQAESAPPHRTADRGAPG